ncbi:hypothetical protein GS597_13565 [Synechococcales cyanobacterium C]|uniref:Uncharacterized protein n=1 Tax=Petrachloros mirabilis ULC683 TaxID=2781853 RepID=A0A8K2A155_9CYAN|nr:hypothetical protein [Petrachloros mirabilis]NCJ07517.1 hypothetical protein [Petrachloros mirabilis ULC683]
MLKRLRFFLSLGFVLVFPFQMPAAQAKSQLMAELNHDSPTALAQGAAHLLGPVEVDLTSIAVESSAVQIESESETILYSETLPPTQNTEFKFQPTFVPFGQEKPEQDRGLQIQVAPR